MHLSGRVTVIQTPTDPYLILTHIHTSRLCVNFSTYMSQQRLLSEGADQSFSVHLAQPQDVQRTTI